MSLSAQNPPESFALNPTSDPQAQCHHDVLSGCEKAEAWHRMYLPKVTLLVSCGAREQTQSEVETELG